jgi:hypothetical protein
MEREEKRIESRLFCCFGWLHIFQMCIASLSCVSFPDRGYTRDDESRFWSAMGKNAEDGLLTQT